VDYYPLPPRDNDRRSGAGLLFDVRRLLRGHGYPALSTSRDVVRLRMALFGFRYGGAEEDDGHGPRTS
jgi:hypothetical protein